MACCLNCYILVVTSSVLSTVLHIIIGFFYGSHSAAKGRILLDLKIFALSHVLDWLDIYFLGMEMEIKFCLVVS